MRETKAVRDSARGETCTVRIPGICNNDRSTTVFAHLSGIRFGHGIGQKTCFGAYACAACHDVLDQRNKRPHWISEDEIKVMFHEAIFETMMILIDKGLLKYG